MTELEKLDAGLEYDFWDEAVNARKLRTIELCAELEKIPQSDTDKRTAVIGELFAQTGEKPTVLNGFNCDYGLHISVGKNL